MTGEELRDIRNKLGLSSEQMGRAFGFAGTPISAQMAIYKYEGGGRPIPIALARLAIMMERHGVPDEWIAGASGPQKPGPKPGSKSVHDRATLRSLADLDLDEPKK